MKTINAMNLVGAETNLSAYGLAVKPTKGPSMELTKEEVYVYQMWVAMAAAGAAKAPLVLNSYRLVIPEGLEYSEEVATQLNSLLIVGNDQPLKTEETVTFTRDGKTYMGRYDSTVFVCPDKETELANVVYFKEVPREAMREPEITGFWAMGIAQARFTMQQLQPLFERAQVTANALRVAKELADSLNETTAQAVEAVSALTPVASTTLDLVELRTH